MALSRYPRYGHNGQDDEHGRAAGSQHAGELGEERYEVTRVAIDDLMESRWQ